MNKRPRVWILMGLWLLAAAAHAGTVTYVYTDPQGTPLMETDASGNITARFEYTPYGVSVPSMGVAPNGVGYTGHVNDPETGLVYMQARYYAPEVGRLASVDPVGPAPGNIFSFNRYAYVNNNPVMHTDPTGMACGGNGEVSKAVQQMRDLSDGCDGAYSQGGRSDGAAHATANSYAGNSKLADKAERTAGSSLQTYAGSFFATMDQAAVAWSSKVQPVTNSLQTEIASKIFLVGTRFQFGPAVSDGAFATVNVNDAPGIPSGVLYGYVHTHPINVGFSPNDLWVVSRWRNTQGLLNPFTTYVSLPNGEVWKWSTEMMDASPQNTWQGFVNQAIKVAK